MDSATEKEIESLKDQIARWKSAAYPHETPDNLYSALRNAAPNFYLLERDILESIERMRKNMPPTQSLHFHSGVDMAKGAVCAIFARLREGK